MTNVLCHIKSVNAGKIAAAGEAGLQTALIKTSVSGSVTVTTLGICGDEHAHEAFHGGENKALHQYPQEHYAAWRLEFPASDKFHSGAFGENLATVGATEESVCIGDIVRAGSVVLELTQPREPCFVLSEMFGVPEFARRVQATRRCGWYWRVLQEGTLRAGDNMVLLNRPNPEWSVAAVMDLWWRDTLNREKLEKLAELVALPEKWRKRALGRLRTGECESWERRFSGK